MSQQDNPDRPSSSSLFSEESIRRGRPLPTPESVDPLAGGYGADQVGPPELAGITNPDSGRNLLNNPPPAESLLDPVPEGSNLGEMLEPPRETVLPTSTPAQEPQASTPPPLFSSDPRRSDADVTPPKELSTPRGMSSTDKLTEIYIPPALEVHQEDIDRFLNCIGENQYYSELFTKGKVSAVFRVKSAREAGFQRATVGQMLHQKKVLMINDLHEINSRFNLFFQLAKLNGRDMPKPILPTLPWDGKEGVDLETQYWQSDFAKFTEALQFILHGMMVQFENKVFEIEKRVMDPKYSRSDTDS